jgi:hypothetical protein
MDEQAVFAAAAVVAGQSQRPHMLLKFLIVCIVVALLFRAAIYLTP